MNDHTSGIMNAEQHINALYIRRSAADKVAAADQENNIQLSAYPFIKYWFFLSN